ncbi:TPA: hypothetical protein ACQ8UO_004858, partial [Escherichia coli]
PARVRIIPRIMLNDVCPVRRGRMGRGSLHGADGIYPRARRWQGAVNRQGRRLSALHHTPRPYRDRPLTFQAVRR